MTQRVTLAQWVSHPLGAWPQRFTGCSLQPAAWEHGGAVILDPWPAPRFRGAKHETCQQFDEAG